MNGLGLSLWGIDVGEWKSGAGCALLMAEVLPDESQKTWAEALS